MSTYSGRSVEPRQESIVYRCVCGERYSARVWRAVSADDVALRTRLIEGDLNRVRCPRCDAAADVQVSVLMHDPATPRLVFVAPTSDRHRELALRAELFAMLAADQCPPPDYVLAAEVVFGAAGLVEALAAPRAPAFVEAVTAQHTADFATLQSLEAPLPPMPEVKERPEVVAAAVQQAPAVEPSVDRPIDETSDGGRVRPAADLPEITQARMTVVVPDPRTAVIERWIAARETATALFVDERVVVCAALGDSILEQFVGRDNKKVRLSLRPQLHRMASYPILALTFVVGEDGERPDESRVLHVPLDLARAAHRVSIDQLQRRCVIELELFDREYLPVVSHTLSVPLEANVGYLFAEAKVALERLPVATRDFDRARTAFLSDRYDRLGRTAIDLPSIDDVSRGTPSVVRNALGAVSRWSEAAAETYLLEIRGYSLPLWRRLAGLTVQRSVELGLFVPRGLAERVARRAAEGENALDLPPWPELIDVQIRHFAELSARLRPSDLAAADEAANWEQLLREAERVELGVDPAVQRLADAAFARAGGRPSRRPRRVDPSPRPSSQQPSSRQPSPLHEGQGEPQESRDADATGSNVHVPIVSTTAELVTMLDDRERRLDAAVELAKRRELPTLPALFVVLRRMSRAEASTLLPKLAGFGTPAERWLIEGLRSKKAFMRQGCALALGRLATPMAIDALVRLLFEEPTEIWSEIARAIGDVGGAALTPLSARVRDVHGEPRDRAVHALAHIAAHGAPSSRTAVEELATGRDALIANLARRALVMAPDVKSAHEAVRTDRREQTLVRAFTRRFYDIVGGGETSADDIHELDWAELESVDDLDLEEADIEPDVDPSLSPMPPAASASTSGATAALPPIPTNTGAAPRRQSDPPPLGALPVSTLGRRPS